MITEKYITDGKPNLQAWANEVKSLATHLEMGREFNKMIAHLNEEHKPIATETRWLMNSMRTVINDKRNDANKGKHIERGSKYFDINSVKDWCIQPELPAGMPEAGAAYLNRFWMKVGLRHAHKWTNCELWYNTYKTLESQLMNGKYAIHLPATYDDVVSTFKSGKFIMTQEWLDKMDLTKDDFIVKAYDIPNKVSYYGFSPSNSTYQYSVVALVDNKDKAMMMRLSIEDNKKIDESMIKKVRKRKVIADIKK